MSEIITTEVAKTRLNVSVQRVRQLVKELGITPTWIGRAMILSPADLKRMKKRNKQVGRRAAGK